MLVRCRPANASERSEILAVSCGLGSEVRIRRSPADTSVYTCAFDEVIPPSATNDLVFAAIRDRITPVARGVNATVFAYGQTGAGTCVEGHGGVAVPRPGPHRIIEQTLTLRKQTYSPSLPTHAALLAALCAPL